MINRDPKKFAESISVGLKIKPKKKFDHSEDMDEEETEHSDDMSEGYEPGELGTVLISAIKHNDGEAIEEAIKSILENC